MARKNKKNKPEERVVFGSIALLLWKNSNGNGETFDSFSINKTVTKRDEEDRSKFSGQVFSLNGLTKRDLENLKQAIERMEETLCGALEGG